MMHAAGVLATTGVVLAGLLAGCAADGEPGGDRLRVVATTTQVGSVAAEVGGEEIELTVLLEPGIEAHDFQLTPADAAALEAADLVLVSGAGLEDWIGDALQGTGDAGLADLSEGIDLRTDPGSGSVDPHYWLDARRAVTMVENARDALSDVRQAAADGFAGRAAELIDRIEVADEEIRTLMNELPPDRRRIVTDHDAMGYFVDAYGLELVGTIFSSLDVSSEPSARDVERLVTQIRDAGVTAVFTESAVDPRLARTVAAEAGARVVDEPLYTDSLGVEGSGADTLDGMLLHNARVIHDALSQG